MMLKASRFRNNQPPLQTEVFQWNVFSKSDLCNLSYRLDAPIDLRLTSVVVLLLWKRETNDFKLQVDQLPGQLSIRLVLHATWYYRL